MLIARKAIGQWLLWGVLGIVLYFCFRIMQPFLMPIFLALILSTLLAPVYDLLLKKLKGRQSLAATYCLSWIDCSDPGARSFSFHFPGESGY